MRIPIMLKMLLVCYVTLAGGGPECGECRREVPASMREYYPTQPINFREYTRYDPGARQDVNEGLNRAEEELRQCLMGDCDYNRKFEQVYYVIPDHILAKATENFELYLLDRRTRASPLSVAGEGVKLVAYPGKETYSDDPRIYNRLIEMNHTQVRLQIEPRVLEFGVRPACKPSTDSFTLWNRGTTNLVIEQIVSDTSQASVHGSAQLPIMLPPQKFIRFHTIYTPDLYGNTQAYAFIKLQGMHTVVYKMKAYGVPNAYGIAPVFRSALNINETVRVPIKLFNPSENETTAIYCIQSPEPRIILSLHNKQIIRSYCSPAPILRVAPKSKSTLFTIEYTPRTPGVLHTHIYLSGPRSTSFTIPIVLRTHLFPIVVSPRLLHFGHIPTGGKPHVLRFTIDTKSAVEIQGIYYKPVPELFLQFAGLDGTVVKRGRQYIGYVAFHAMRAGTYRGQIYFQTNVTGMLELEYFAEATGSPPLLLLSPLVTINSEQRFAKYPMQLVARDGFGSAVTFAETSCTNISVTIKCQDEGSLEEHPCIFIPRSTKKMSDLQGLTLKPNYIQPSRFPIKSYFTLLTTDALYSVGFEVQDAGVYCSYDRYGVENGVVQKLKITKQCSEIRDLHLGSCGNYHNTFSLNLTTSSQFPVHFNNIYLSKTSQTACFDRVLVFNKADPHHYKAYSLEKDLGLDKKGFVVLDKNVVISIQMVLSPAYCTGNRKLVYNDGTVLRSEVQIILNTDQVTFELSYAFRTGELNLSPSIISLHTAFSGVEKSMEIYGTSSFKLPLNIVRMWSPELKMEVQQETVEFPPYSMRMIGRVVFDPGRDPDEVSVTRYKNAVMQWRESTLCLEEFAVWQMRQRVWSNRKERRAATSVFVETDLVPIIEIPIRTEEVEPSLVRNVEFDFGTTQVSASNLKEFLISNPSNHPMLFQVFITEFSPVNYKYSNLFEAFATPKCFANVTQPGLEECCRRVREAYRKTHMSLENMQYCGQMRLAAESQAGDVFWLPHQYSQPGIIAPKSAARIKDVSFTPANPQRYDSVLLIKNNLTILSEVRLSGRGGRGLIKAVESIHPEQKHTQTISIMPQEANKDATPLKFQILPMDVIQRPNDKSSAYSHWLISQGISHLLELFYISIKLQHTRVFTFRNDGELPLTVRSITVSGRLCGAFGIALSFCSEIVLHPGQLLSLHVSYKISGVRKRLNVPLVFHTSTGTQSFNLSVAISQEVFPLIPKFTEQNSSIETYWRVLLVFSLLLCLMLAMARGLSELAVINSIGDSQIVADAHLTKNKYQSTFSSRMKLLKKVLIVMTQTLELTRTRAEPQKARDDARAVQQSVEPVFAITEAARPGAPAAAAVAEQKRESETEEEEERGADKAPERGDLEHAGEIVQNKEVEYEFQGIGNSAPNSELLTSSPLKKEVEEAKEELSPLTIEDAKIDIAEIEGLSGAAPEPHATEPLESAADPCEEKREEKVAEEVHIDRKLSEHKQEPAEEHLRDDPLNATEDNKSKKEEEEAVKPAQPEVPLHDLHYREHYTNYHYNDQYQNHAPASENYYYTGGRHRMGEPLNKPTYGKAQVMYVKKNSARGRAPGKPVMMFVKKTKPLNEGSAAVNPPLSETAPVVESESAVSHRGEECRAKGKGKGEREYRPTKTIFKRKERGSTLQVPSAGQEEVCSEKASASMKSAGSAEDSPRKSCESDIYKVYNPFSQMKLEFSPAAYESREQDEGEEEDDDEFAADSELFAAFRTVNSLFDKHSYFPHAGRNKPQSTAPSLLSELREDSELYDPSKPSSK